MILITGASGHIGSRVAQLLKMENASIRLMGRDVTKLPALKGAEVIRADYADSASLERAFDGIDVAFIVSGYEKPEKRAELHINAIANASKMGVKKLVYLSFQGASPDSKFPMSRDHFLTEEFLRKSGVPFTALRDSFYMDLIPEMFNKDGIMKGPAGNGKVAWVAREDVARAVTAELLNREANNMCFDITGPESISLTETAFRLSALLGKTLRYQEETINEAEEWRKVLGAPQWEVDTWVGSYLAIANNEVGKVSNNVKMITGRNPLTIEEYLEKLISVVR